MPKTKQTTKATAAKEPGKIDRYLARPKADRDAELATLDREFTPAELTPLTPVQRASWDRAKKRKPGRPVVGQGAKRVPVTIEGGLLAEADAYAKRHGLKRTQLIADGLRLAIDRGASGGAAVVYVTLPGDVVAPLILCSQCGEPIDGSRPVMAISSGAPVGQPATAYYVHIGECDRRFSKEHGGLGGSAHLQLHFNYLIRNSLNEADRRWLIAALSEGLPPAADRATADLQDRIALPKARAKRQIHL